MEESIKTRVVTAASRCDVGRVRKINQDTVFCSLEPVGLLPNLFIVADGMGGHKAGDLASTEAVRFIAEQKNTPLIRDKFSSFSQER